MTLLVKVKKVTLITSNEFDKEVSAMDRKKEYLNPSGKEERHLAREAKIMCL